MKSTTSSFNFRLLGGASQIRSKCRLCLLGIAIFEFRACVQRDVVDSELHVSWFKHHGKMEFLVVGDLGNQVYSFPLLLGETWQV